MQVLLAPRFLHHPLKASLGARITNTKIVPTIWPHKSVLSKEIMPIFPVSRIPALIRQPPKNMGPVLPQLIAAREEARPKERPVSADNPQYHARQRTDVGRKTQLTR